MSLVFAHRGAHWEHVENTLAAFELAAEQGADGVELDVRATRDGQVVVFHDADLARLGETRDGQPDTRLLADLTLGELPQVGGAPIPKLSAVLDLVLGAGMQVNVEVKADGGAAAGVIESRSLEERSRIIVSSFLTEELDAFAEKLPHVRRALLFDLIDERRTAYAQTCHGVHPHWELCTPDRVDRWKTLGLFVNAWTVNDPADAVALMGMGLDALVTDNVPGVRKACRSQS